jgi:hypothetical protein
VARVAHDPKKPAYRLTPTEGIRTLDARFTRAVWAVCLGQGEAPVGRTVERFTADSRAVLRATGALAWTAVRTGSRGCRLPPFRAMAPRIAAVNDHASLGRPARPARGLRVTERDKEMVRWIGRLRMTTARQWPSASGLVARWATRD